MKHFQGDLSMKRFNLVITEEMYASLEEVATIHQTSKTDIIKRYIKLGFMVEEEEVIYRANDGEMKKLVFL